MSGYRPSTVEPFGKSSRLLGCEGLEGGSEGSGRGMIDRIVVSNVLRHDQRGIALALGIHVRVGVIRILHLDPVLKDRNDSRQDPLVVVCLALRRYLESDLSTRLQWCVVQS